MKTHHRLCFLVFSLVVLQCFSGRQRAQVKLFEALAGSRWFGAITPEEPVWMAGYASRDKPSEGKSMTCLPRY